MTCRDDCSGRGLSTAGGRSIARERALPEVVFTETADSGLALLMPTWLAGNTCFQYWSTLPPRPSALLLISTPEPWAFFLGFWMQANRSVAPVLRLKNSVPLYERATDSVTGNSELRPHGWEHLKNAILFRNGGLTGALAHLEARVPSLAGVQP